MYYIENDYLCNRDKINNMFNLIHMSMLAIVRTIGKNLYRVEAFVMTSNGPQWLPVGETKHENLALELRDYVRFHATRRWIARKIKTFEAAQRAAQDND